jgi:hypothetical protein
MGLAAARRLLVLSAVAWNLIALRPELEPVSYLDDGSVHQQMVRFAARQIGHGRLPLTSWFPYLGLGSPHFLHYQSLPAMLTGLAGLAIGPDAAYRWSLYLLLSLWPLTVYAAARLFGLGRAAAAAAAAMSPFLRSVIGLGYEQPAYVWVGYGVWTQLWASMTLPLAWGFSWRAVRRSGPVLPAVALVALTTAFHFETGYLALGGVVVMAAVADRPLLERARRGVILLGGSLLASAWVIVPVWAERYWAAKNEVLQGTPLVQGYGAGKVLGWLFSGRLLDNGRLPVLSLLALAGLALAFGRWRTRPEGRALIALLALSTVLSSGPNTFGSLMTSLPGGGDIFFRRFMMGIQLPALLLAGLGAAWCARAAYDMLRARIASRRDSGLGWSAGALLAAVVVLAPAWSQLDSAAGRNAAAISQQRRAEASSAPALDRLIEIVKRAGAGRAYAGMPSNWGAGFTLGAVPVFKYLESRDVDEVGYTLRTASLMTGPEYYFDEQNPGDYDLFGIRYLILPAGKPPPVPARLVLRSGAYVLWTVGTPGYLRVGTIVGYLRADRANLGSLSIALLSSRLPRTSGYLGVRFSGLSGGRYPAASSPGAGVRSPGTVLEETDRLDQGLVSGRVRMVRPGLVVLSASFDPGWQLTVDGRGEPTLMIAPALVGAVLPAGDHRLVLRYVGYDGYGPLALVSVLTLVALLAFDLRSPALRSAAWWQLSDGAPGES